MFAKGMFKKGVARLGARQPLAVSAMRSQMLLSACSVRAFSDFNAIEKGAQKLNKALEKEIKYENDNYSQLEDIEVLLLPLRADLPCRVRLQVQGVRGGYHDDLEEASGRQDSRSSLRVQVSTCVAINYL